MKGDLFLTMAWFCILAIMGFITALLVKWDPDISGSGIPHVMGEVKGYFDVNWWKATIAKFIGGTLTALEVNSRLQAAMCFNWTRSLKN